MPRSKKLPGTAVDRRNGQKLSLAPSYAVEQFDPPAGITEAAKAAWQEFWADRPAQLMTPSSKIVLLRWITALNRYLVTSAEADQSPVVTGSTGQSRDNPLYRVAEKALAEVTACEKQLGIGGLNAANLGLAAIAEKKSLAEMNARLTGTNRPERVDPRVRVIEGE